MLKYKRCSTATTLAVLAVRTSAENEKCMKLNYKRTILVGFAFFLISAFWQAYDAIVPLALNYQYGLPHTISGVVMSLDNVLAVFMLPIFGALSDKVMTRFGKRTPFVVIGTLAAVLSFIVLTLVNGIQLNALKEAGIVDAYNNAYNAFKSAKEGLKEGLITEEAFAQAETIFNSAKESLQAQSLEITMGNIWPLVGFLGVLLLVLISMATFRSPAVALMPDVTVKPLRSKANAIINLMGIVGQYSRAADQYDVCGCRLAVQPTEFFAQRLEVEVEVFLVEGAFAIIGHCVPRFL